MSRDPQQWQQILTNADPSELPHLCTEALEVWPSSTEIWQVYLNATPDLPARGELFQRALRSSVDPRIYTLYIDHIRKTNAEELNAAFEFALECVSCDPESGAIWKDYIDYLQTQPAGNDYEEQYKMDRVRKAFKKCIHLPLTNVELLWRRYGSFENKISRASARKFIDERSPGYMRARQTVKTYMSLVSDLDMSTMQAPETAVANTSKWMQYVQFERSNLLELNEDELNLRVSFAFKRATVCARWSAPLWFAAGLSEGADLLVQGCEALPESILLHFKLANVRELADDFEGVTETLTSLAEALEDPTVAYTELIRCANRMRGNTEVQKILSEWLKTADPSAGLYAQCAELESEPLKSRIWRAGYAKFGVSNLEFAEKYLTYLFTVGDAVNGRSVFELAIADQPPHKRLWKLMLELENKFAQTHTTSLAALASLEDRYRSLFPENNELDMFVQRYANLGVKFDLEEKINVEEHMEIETPDLDVAGTGKLAKLLGMLPKPATYDGPLLNTNLLMQIVSRVSN